MPPLRPVPSASAWPDEILEDAKGEFWGTISVYAPSTTGTYSPDTGALTGSTAGATLISNRAARIQHIRLPLEVAGSYEWGVKRRYTFQIEIQANDPFIPKGSIVKVTSAPRDPNLAKITFQVASATNSDHAALRTIVAFTEFGKVTA